MINLTGKLQHLKRTVQALCCHVPAGPRGCYVEIGVHRGRSVTAIASHLQSLVKQLEILGYDVFDSDCVDHAAEDNGKGAGNMDKCKSALNRLIEQYSHVSYTLTAGKTRDTLQPICADWAYIDGGHSYETVRWDHEQLKNSSVIVFDDADLEGVNQYLWEIKDRYAIYDLEPLQGCRQVAIINSDRYDFTNSDLRPFQGQNPIQWRPTR